MSKATVRLLAMALALACLAAGCAKKTAQDGPPQDSTPAPTAAGSAADAAAGGSSGADGVVPAGSTAGGPAVTDYGFTPPSGFAQADSRPGLYYAPDYPGDASNICTAVDGHDPYFDAYDAALMQEAQSRALSGQLGAAVAVTVDDFSYFTLDGLPAWRLETHYTAEEKQIRQLTVSVNAACRYTFTFTQVDTEAWSEAFAESAGSLWFALGDG